MADVDDAAGDPEAMPEEALRPAPELTYPDDFIDWLHWLASDQGYDAAAIVHVVEKPHNYADEWNTYLNLGGPDRA